MKHKTIIIFIAALTLLFAGCSISSTSFLQTETDSGSSTELSAQAALAAGTIQLESTDLAVTEAQAKDLLQLWQALQALSNNDTTASVELDAVVSEIEAAMTNAQIETIANMSLSTETLTEIMANSTMAFQAGQGADNTESAAFSGPPDSGEMPGGGMPGGDLAGGAMPTEANNTAPVDMSSGGTGQMQEPALRMAVIQLLQSKVSAVSIDAP
ncbi:MAG: hypothetical protein KC421_24925 [Anaerolineales bacterium]|nr:hypothetical protein [Anaerolineales bacterium]